LLLATVLAAPPAGAAGPAPAPAGRTVVTVAPAVDYASRLAFDVTSITPTLVTSTGPDTLTIAGTMRNTGSEELIDLAYRFQRGAALTSTADVRTELAEPSEPVAQVPSRFEPIPGSLAGGASVPFVFTTPLTGSNSLGITTPGVYPVMVNVNGAVVLPAGPLEARIGELHLLVTVLSVPGGPTGGTEPAPAGNPTPFNFIWPMVDVPHLGVDGVFLNDDLLAAISPGGRLDLLLTSLSGESARALPADAITLVIDPQLLDELDRMTGLYRVVAPPGAAQPPVAAIEQARSQAQAAGGAATPTGDAGTTTGPATTPATNPATVPPTVPAGPSTGAAAGSPGATTAAATGANPGEGATAVADPTLPAVDIPGTVAGTGQQAAASFLERLRAVAATRPVVELPYGDPDVVALVRAGMSGEIATAQQHGQEVVRRVWGDLPTATNPAASTTAYPINGAVDGATLSTLLAGGARSGLLSDASVALGSATDPATAGALIEPDPGVDGLPSVIARTDVLGGLDKLIDDERRTGWATKVNSLTALLAQQRADGTATPAVFAPVRRWAPDSAGLQGLVQLLGDLGRSGIITGRTLADLAAAPTRIGTPDYPQLARDQELSPEYLDRVTAARSDVAALRAGLATVPQPADPAVLLDPLDRALNTSASTAFRNNPTVGDANVGTVESTVAAVRAGVQIADTGNNYTLASSTSPLLLTVQNNTAYDVPVTVALAGGEMVGLTVTDAPVQIIPAGRSQQVKIPTEVTRSGQFQVTASLIGPDGVAWGTPVQLTVQSSAYGALTVVLIVGAGGVLVIMVFLRVRQRLRGRRERLAAAAAAAAAGAGAGPADPPAAGPPGPRPDRLVSPTRSGPTAPRVPDGTDDRQDFRS
ncbi:DUF6049 family protein, partial [Nakamurella sp.]|uniref:DUF6049 family protein n=1 Tax=Nakamurella sp. TaxID=1869182 RepID=UPI003B3A6557